MVKTHVPGFFEKYIDVTADFMRRANAKDITPIRLLARINAITFLLEAMLPMIERVLRIRTIFVRRPPWTVNVFGCRRKSRSGGNRPEARNGWKKPGIFKAARNLWN